MTPSCGHLTRLLSKCQITVPLEGPADLGFDPSITPGDLGSVFMLVGPCWQNLQQFITRGAGQTVKRQMVTYRITAFGKELAGFGQVGNALETLFPLATVLRRSRSDGKSQDMDFPT